MTETRPGLHTDHHTNHTDFEMAFDEVQLEFIYQCLDFLILENLL